jgi:hypothetical protein
MLRYLALDYDGALVALRRGLEIDPTHYDRTCEWTSYAAEKSAE